MLPKWKCQFCSPLQTYIWGKNWPHLLDLFKPTMMCKITLLPKATNLKPQSVWLAFTCYVHVLIMLFSCLLVFACCVFVFSCCLVFWYVWFLFVVHHCDYFLSTWNSNKGKSGEKKNKNIWYVYFFVFVLCLLEEKNCLFVGWSPCSPKFP